MIIMKILLLHVPPLYHRFSSSKQTKTKAITYPPLGLLYIGGVLEKEGHNVDLIDFMAEENPKDLLKKTLPSADVVGISVYTKAYKEAAQIAQSIKKMNPNIPIIIGGPHSTFYPDRALHDIPAADISVEGEGEEVIKDIMKVLNGTKKISEISGIQYRKGKKIKAGKPAKIIKDLDPIPLPARHLVDKYEYGTLNNANFYIQKFTAFLTSRGCPFKCRFCTRHVLSMKNFRVRSAENVIKELIEVNKNYGSVMIVDDNFLLDKKRANKILDGIIENGLNLEIYIQGARVDSADINLYKKMKKAGVKHLCFGLESGNQDVLNFYNKQITLSQIREAINLSKKMKFFTVGNFILGAPIETKKHIEQTIKFACSLPLDIATFNPLFYQRGSDLWIEAVKNGKLKKDEVSIADSRKGLGNFTGEELEKYCEIAVKRFYLRASYIIRLIIKSIINRNFTILRVGRNYV